MVGEPLMARRRNLDAPDQLTLWQSVAEVYLRSGDREISNPEMYQAARAAAGVDPETFSAKVPIGRSGAEHSPMERTARWVQQTLKMRGVIERVPDKRGVWRLTREAKTELHRVKRGFVIVGFSTKLGVALWADCRDAMAALDEPLHLVLTSPPYALQKARAYGNPNASEYVDFICRMLEPVVPKLAEGGSVVLNVTNDVFLPGSPARELLTERLTIALHDRLGLFKMDSLIWFNRSKAPGPVQWASLQRTQLNVGWEPILWMAKNPLATYADNRRVLQPHSERHAKLIAQGGEQRERSYSDGRYNLKVGRFSNPTAGRIPKNVLEFGHSCSGQRAYKREAAALGLPAHGAPWPESLVEFMVRYLTTEGMLVADIFGGSQTTAAVCERLDRRWLTSDVMAEYVRGGATRFSNVWINPELDEVLGLSPRNHGAAASSLALGG